VCTTVSHSDGLCVQQDATMQYSHRHAEDSEGMHVKYLCLIKFQNVSTNCNYWHPSSFCYRCMH
jgi:hypothetical protein